jgi:hypothetical protein
MLSQPFFNPPSVSFILRQLVVSDPWTFPIDIRFPSGIVARSKIVI